MQLDNRLCDQYLDGVDDFLEHAFGCSHNKDRVLCPCIKCNNTYHKGPDNIKFDLVRYEIGQNYINWYHHGEEIFVDTSIISESDGDDEEDEDDDDNDGCLPMLEEAVGMSNFNHEKGGDSFNTDQAIVGKNKCLFF